MGYTVKQADLGISVIKAGVTLYCYIGWSGLVFIVTQHRLVGCSSPQPCWMRVNTVTRIRLPP